MKFKKAISWIVLIGLFVPALVGCSSRRANDQSPFAGRIETPGMYIGTLPESESPLSIMDVERQEDSCTYLGKTYKRVSFPSLKKCGSGQCYWQLDCNYLTAIGKTAADETVYAVYSKDQELLSLLLVGTDVHNLTCDWYILDTLDVLNLSSYSFRDFSVQNLSGKKDRMYSNEEIWEYHISEEELDTSYLSVDHADEYLLFLRSKENPWLVYELRYMILYEGYLYIYNTHNSGSILIQK